MLANVTFVIPPISNTRCECRFIAQSLVKTKMWSCLTVMCVPSDLILLIAMDGPHHEDWTDADAVIQWFRHIGILSRHNSAPPPPPHPPKSMCAGFNIFFKVISVCYHAWLYAYSQEAVFAVHNFIHMFAASKRGIWNFVLCQWMQK